MWLASAVLSVCLAPVAHALEGDSEQPMYIDSDSATYDENEGTSTYIGNVVSTQGSMKVTSEKLVIYTVDGEVNQLVWTGNMVHLKQTPDGGGKDVVGESLRAEYFPETETLKLIDKATVWQNDTIYKSDVINYDLAHNFVTAGNKESDKARVSVTILPKPKNCPKGDSTCSSKSTPKN